MRGPSNERGRCLTTWPMEGNIGWAGTRASPSENLACILGSRGSNPGKQARSETKERMRRGQRGGGGYVGFTRGFRLLPDRKKQAG